MCVVSDTWTTYNFKICFKKIYLVVKGIVENFVNNVPNLFAVKCFDGTQKKTFWRIFKLVFSIPGHFICQGGGKKHKRSSDSCSIFCFFWSHTIPLCKLFSENLDNCCDRNIKSVNWTSMWFVNKLFFWASSWISVQASSQIGLI